MTTIAPRAPEARVHASSPLEVASATASVTIVLPCLNEEEAISDTVAEALLGLRRAGVVGEVLVVDNGSTDRSVELALDAGARVIHETRRGYGAAHLAGIAAAEGDVIVMADADCTYDLEHVGQLLEVIDDGADMVVANRLDMVDSGAMPLLHRWVGTPVITRLLRLMTGAPLRDSQSGYRAFRASTIRELALRSPGMEYASEMLLRAVHHGLDVREISLPYRARVGESKLNTFSDGWRHIKMLLVLSPHLALIAPGLLLLLLGVGLIAISAAIGVSAGVNTASWVAALAGAISAIIGALAVLHGAMASARVEFAPAAVRARVPASLREGRVNAPALRFGIVAAAGAAVIGLVAVGAATLGATAWLPAATAVGVTLFVLGAAGLIATFSADAARESLWD